MNLVTDMNRIAQKFGDAVFWVLVLLLITTPMAWAIDQERTPAVASAPVFKENTSMRMTVGSRHFAVTLEDSPTTRALGPMLPLTLHMTELNGNEKYARLPRSLPTQAVQLGTIQVGDVLLYGDDTLVVFYKAHRSSYSYTRIGRIHDTAGLAQALGSGNPQVTWAVP
jgi:hypothetical protein